MAKRKPTTPAPAPAPAPGYSKYQEWVDAGRPYWPGVSLFNQLGVLPTLRTLLNKRENAFNRAKLDSELRTRLATVPGTPPEKKGKGTAVSKPELPPTPASRAEAPGEGAQLSQLGPEVPKAYADPRLKAIPFGVLPAQLQQDRIDTMAKYRERSLLHDQLAGEWEVVRDAQGNPMGRRWKREPLAGEEAARAAQTIVELSDAIANHFDACEAWATTGALPETPKTLLEELGALTDLQLERRLVNQVLHRIKRWKRAVAERDGDELVQAQMELTKAEQERDAIKAIQAERAKKAATELDAFRKHTMARGKRTRESKAKHARKKRST